MATVKVAVKQDENDVVVAEVLASAIRDISQAVRKWNAAGMRTRALICLVHEVSRVGKKDIEYVLNTISALESEFCIKK